MRAPTKAPIVQVGPKQIFETTELVSPKTKGRSLRSREATYLLTRASRLVSILVASIVSFEYLVVVVVVVVVV